jgi:hypothetical protein
MMEKFLSKQKTHGEVGSGVGSEQVEQIQFTLPQHRGFHSRRLQGISSDGIVFIYRYRAKMKMQICSEYNQPHTEYIV